MIQDFDAQRALLVSAHAQRVQTSDDQHRLDIARKERVSALPWRGQFSPQLIEYLLNKHCNKGDMVLDPFCGSGTVIHEAARADINALGLDVNPAAICLAKVSEVALVQKDARWALVEAIRKLSTSLQIMASREEDGVGVDSAVELLNERQLDYIERVALEGFLLLAFSNGYTAFERRISKITDRYLSMIMEIPKSSGRLNAEVGDARAIKVDDDTFDYLVTSPPYINVFNYHQNYRPIIEALGHTPLAAAKSEIGANRKFRQNRYMTVIQYCMDMAQFFLEAARILKASASLTIVLGRESNVRSVPFKNGEMINALACEGMGFQLIDWNERKFMNRFGEEIFEDILTITPRKNVGLDAVEIGRLVGRQALQNSLSYCHSERSREIVEAIEAAPVIGNSPLVPGCEKWFK